MRRARTRLRVRFYPGRVRPGGGDSELTPSQAVRLVERAGRIRLTDESRHFEPSAPLAPAPPRRAPAPSRAAPGPPGRANQARGRHRAPPQGWLARLLDRLLP